MEHIRKYLPLLRLSEFGLSKAADYLDAFVSNTLVRSPPMDVSQSLVLKQFNSITILHSCVFDVKQASDDDVEWVSLFEGSG